MPICPDCREKEVKNEGSRCRSCAARMGALKLWQDPAYAARVSEGLSKAHARGAYDEMFASEEWGRKMSESARETSNRPEVKRKIGEASARLWSDPAYRERRGRGMARAADRISAGVRAAHGRGVYIGTQARVGEANPNWRGGISFDPYGPEWTGALKKSIRERDNYTCVVCGAPENGVAHDVHHKDYNKQNNRLPNLVTLCHSCHSKTGGNRPYWQAYLTGVGYELCLGAC